MKLNMNYPLIQRIREEEEFRTPKNLLLKLLIFGIVFLIASIAESVAMFGGFFPKLMQWASSQMTENGGGTVSSQDLMDKLQNMLLDPEYTYILLVSTVLATVVTVCFCIFVEGRPLRTMGFRKENGILKYFIGLGAGFVMFSLIVLVSYLMGGLTWNGFKGGSAGSIALVFFGFMLQGMSEEVIFRGYLMTTILRHHNVWWAVGVNSVLFAAAHCGNKGFSIMAVVNLILYAVMISLYTLRTDNLWGACAVHGIWNFVQGNFYGLPVSGIDSGDTVFSMSLKGENALLNGGAFGLEASLATTIVMGVIIALLLLLPYHPKADEDAA
ncbi:MAG: CPBP family intramembrane metalloprotease [Oscillospiraceae bacterium]|nr:CPBP family intramembrane metalloprotease [Oscillospiraceae bacterium]